MKKLLVTYLTPPSVITEWKKTDPSTRKAVEEKMQADWKKWMAEHAKLFADLGAGVGKTKVVTPRGVSETKNNIMLYSVVEAESPNSVLELARLLSWHGRSPSHTGSEWRPPSPP